MYKIPIIFALLFFCQFLSFGQDMTFYHYGLKEGLSQQTIRSILKDSKGFLWLGTQDGLNKFDGHSFKIFRNQPTNPHSISGKFINAIMENNDGTIWIASANNGVTYYDPKTDVFIKTSQNSGNCTSLSKDTDGNIYATFLGKGLVVFIKTSVGYKTKILNISKSNNLLFSESYIHKNILFVGTTDGNLYQAIINETLNLDFKTVTLNNRVGIIDEIYSYNDLLLLGTSKGLFAIDKSKDVKDLNLKQYDKQLTENLVVESITSKNNTIYVGTDNGLFILKEFNSVSQTFGDVTIYKGDTDNTNSVTSNRVYDILIDDNLLWIGTNNLDVASLKPPVFKTINSNSTPAINNNYVFSILKTQAYTFIGTRDGLNCIDTVGNITYITKENTNQKLSYNVIRGITLDNTNNLWLATTKGISVIDLNNFNPKKPRIIAMYNEENNPSSLSDNKTRSIFLDHNNSIWVTTYGGGINRFTGNLKNGNYKFERYMTSGKNTISSNFTFQMSQDSENKYWITSENGLNQLRFQNDTYSNPEFKIYNANEKDLTSLKNNTTLFTHHDSNSQLWIATQNGLHKFDKSNNNFIQYNESHGLTNTYVYGILEDKDKKLWVSTNDGLFQFNPETESFTQFSLKDGVQSTEFNLGAQFNDTITNTLYFGGVNGFNLFNPDRVASLDAEGHLALTELQINGSAINPITHPKIISKSITESNKIELNYTDFPCTLKFSDLDLRPQKNTTFVYKLNDNDWNITNESQEIQLLDLPKGKHNLQLQGQSRNQLWKKSPLELSIIVNPPWYKSNLAYLLYLLAFLGISYQFYKLQLKQQFAGLETKRLQELDTLKSRFITNITHEFRTPLTIIMGYIDTLKNGLSNDGDYAKPIKSIAENSGNLLTLVNEMMDLAKLEQGNLALNITQQDVVSYTKYLADSFSSLAESKNITINFNAEVKALIMDYDIEKYRQIITNLISNAVKFSEADSHIEVLLSKTKTNQVHIDIIDQGRGIPEDELLFIFDRFYQATTNSFKKNRGTGIGLALTKELVLLMKGTIDVSSQKGKGTTFSIVIPITNTAKLNDSPSKVKAQNVRTFNFNELQQNSNNSNLPSILVVEDNKEIAHYIGTCLAGTYNLQFALNGQIGFEMAEKHIPDIVITDVMMPIMDGYELTHKLQNTKTTNHIPIVILTAKAQQEDKLLGLKSGADAYVTKPFQKEELLVRINTLIKKRQKLQERYSLKKIISIDTSSIKADKNLEFLDNIIQHIHKNIENADYNAPKLAADVFMSESQLYRKLKAVTNKSSAIFIRSVRLEKAKELLQNTTLSVSEVAYTTGFSNPNWFGKAFKDQFGVNPSEIKS